MKIVTLELWGLILPEQGERVQITRHEDVDSTREFNTLGKTQIIENVDGWVEACHRVNQLIAAGYDIDWGSNVVDYTCLVLLADKRVE